MSLTSQELASEILSLHTFERCQAVDYCLAHASFQGGCLSAGQWLHGNEPHYLVMSPRDVVLARPR